VICTSSRRATCQTLLSTFFVYPWPCRNNQIVWQRLTWKSQRTDLSGVSKDVLSTINYRCDNHSATPARAFVESIADVWLLRSWPTIGCSVPGCCNVTRPHWRSPILETATVYGEREGLGQWVGAIRHIRLACAGMCDLYVDRTCGCHR